MLAYWVPGGKPPIFTEIFDVRERTYPDETGRTELHQQFQPVEGQEYQLGLPSFMEAAGATVAELLSRTPCTVAPPSLAVASGNTPEAGAALVEAIQGGIAMFGPTTDNVRSLMQALGQGDPEQAALLVKQARGNTGYETGGLADLLLRHMLGEPTLPGPSTTQAPSGYEIQNGQPVFTGVDGGTDGYRIEDGRPVYQEPQAPSAMGAQEPPELAARRLQADLTHPELHADIAQRANAILDEWTQDEDGYDEVFGGGGVCDQISNEIASAIYDRYDDVGIMDGGQDGDDHAYPIAYRNGAAFAIDIPPDVYETGQRLLLDEDPRRRDPPRAHRGGIRCPTSTWVSKRATTAKRVPAPPRWSRGRRRLWRPIRPRATTGSPSPCGATAPTVSWRSIPSSTH